MMGDDSLPKYTDDGLSNRDIFLSDRNSVLFYCEDEGFEEFYIRLFKRAIPDVKIEDVFCLGGKSQVLNKLKESSRSEKRCIFVVDKDFDDLLNKVKINSRLVYLGRYSIENYFIEEDYFVGFVLDKCRRVRRADIVAGLDFDSRLAQVVIWYTDLCRIFVVSQKFNLGVPSTKMSAEEFCLPDSSINEEWRQKYIAVFNNAVFDKAAWLLENGDLQAQLDDAFKPALKAADIADGTALDHFPGKHLLYAFLKVCHDLFGTGNPDDVEYEFLMRSAERSDSEVFHRLQQQISAAVTA